MITVFYDGKCGLCSREIRYYMKIAPVNVFEWVDITLPSESFTALGYTLEEGLRVLHVSDAKGVMHLGVDGFIVIWQALPYWWLLAKIVKQKPIHGVAVFLYQKFAAWRFKKMMSAEKKNCTYSP